MTGPDHRCMCLPPHRLMKEQMKGVGMSKQPGHGNFHGGRKLFQRAGRGIERFGFDLVECLQ